MLQRTPAEGTLPRAENFDYAYPDVSSDDYATFARDKQRALRDGSGYQAEAHDNQSASVLVDKMKTTHLFHFFGHGGEFNFGQSESYLYCWNGTNKSFIVQKQAMATLIRNRLGINTEVQVLDDTTMLAPNALSQMLLAVLEGCHTASTSPTYGSPAQAMVDRGARSVLGFRATIYVQAARPWAHYYWEYLCQGHPTEGAVGWRSAANLALATINDLGLNFPGSGINTRTFVGDQQDFKIYPAGKRDDREGPVP